jgi:outer membrane protein TolC
MVQLRKWKRFASVFFLCTLSGCASEQTNPSHREPAASQNAPAWSSSQTSGAAQTTPVEYPPLPEVPVRVTAVSQTSYQAPIDQPAGIAAGVQVIPAPSPLMAPAEAASDPDDPFPLQSELSVDALVHGVQAGNPSLQAMVSAWQAAAQRYPQMISLDDPMFGFMIGPAGVGTMDGGGWMVMGSQKIPWPGKRQLRGEAAQAESDMAYRDVAQRRLTLAEAAKMAFYDYYTAHRQLQVNNGSMALAADFREIARVKYESNKVPQQDLLMADLEIGQLQLRRAELARSERVAMARINTLLHREATCPLPPPPAKIGLPGSVPPSDVLQQWAAQQRPDLSAICDQIRAERANLELAWKQYYPDMELVAKYDGFMPDNMRSQVGMNVNVPLWQAKRSAAVREASSRLCQRQAEYQDRLDQVRLEVQSAYEQLIEAKEVVRLFDEKILPAAEQNVQSGRSNYMAGNVDFLRLVEAHRQLYQQQEKYVDVTAEFHRRLATLERAVGGMK